MHVHKVTWFRSLTIASFATCIATCMFVAGCGNKSDALTASPSTNPQPAVDTPPSLTKNPPLRPLVEEPVSPSGPSGGTVVDPEVENPPDTLARETVIRVRYPFVGRYAVLRGSVAPLSWDSDTAMTYVGDETYEYRTNAWQNVEVEVKPVMRGGDLGADGFRWSTGGNFHVAAGAARILYPAFYDTVGRTEELFPAFDSEFVAPRQVTIYYPASYFENTLAVYPVLYMHDGQNCFDDALSFGGQSWKVRDSLDAAFGSGASREVIVVAMSNTAARIAEYTPSASPRYPGSGKGGAYLRFVAEELKPQIDRLLRTNPDVTTTGIMGSSLGGLISMSAGLELGATFGLVGALSPSTWWDNRFILGATETSDAAKRAGKFYLDSGNAGDSTDGVEDTTQLAGAVRALGYRDGENLLHVVQDKATHSEFYWAQRFPGAVAFLFGTR